MSKRKGRLQKYEDLYNYWSSGDGIAIIRGLLIQGYTFKSICENKIGIRYRTFLSWCKKNENFDKLRYVKREYADALVEDALLKRCRGFKEGDIYFPPDSKAIDLYYKNKEHRQDFENRQQNKPQIIVNINFDDGKNSEISKLDDDLPKDDNLEN